MSEVQLSLAKGEKTDLTKANPGLDKVSVGLGWDASNNGNPFDLDAFALLLKGGKLQDRGNSVVFYNNKNAPGVKHLGDNLTGAGEGDDETIEITLSALPAEVDEVVLAVNIYEASSRNERFGQVKNSTIHLYETSTKKELLRFDLNEDYSSYTGVLMGRLYKKDGEWKFQSIGEGVNGDINAIAHPYNV